MPFTESSKKYCVWHLVKYGNCIQMLNTVEDFFAEKGDYVPENVCIREMELLLVQAAHSNTFIKAYFTAALLC